MTRTRDNVVADDATVAAFSGHPADRGVPAALAPNVRVAPAPAQAPAVTPDPAPDAEQEADGWDCGVNPPRAAQDGAVEARAVGSRAADAHAADAHAAEDFAVAAAAADDGAVDSAAAVGAATAGAKAADAARRPGRPRSEKAEQAIIDATIEALGEYGIDGVHCEDVATRAGVGKATLYRRWPGKEDLLIAAFAAMRRPLPAPCGDSVREDLVALLTVTAADMEDPRYAQQFALLHGAGDRYPRLVARYKERVVEPRREAVRSVLRRGIATGELRPDIDVEVAMLLLTGAVMARGKHDLTPAAPGFVDQVVDELLHGIAAR